MGLLQSREEQPPPAPDLWPGTTLNVPPDSPEIRLSAMPSEPVTLTSLFTGVKPPALTHDHPGFIGADVRDIQASLLAKGLPLEIARVILDKALVWTSCHRYNRTELTVPAISEARETRGQESNFTDQEDEIGHELPRLKGNVFYLVSAPLGCDGSSEEQKGKGKQRAGTKEKAVPDWATIAKVSDKDLRAGSIDLQDAKASTDAIRRRFWPRAVIISTLSKDQGWASEHRFYGGYAGSWTWFQVGLLRDGEEVGERYDVQRNIVAGQYYKEHKTVLDASHPLLKEARDGDRIVLWVRAMYPGWVNYVRKASITVHGAPFPPQ